MTDQQVKEFGDILNGLKAYEPMFKDLKGLSDVPGGFAALRALPEELKKEQKRNDELQGDIKKLRKSMANFQGPSGVKWIGNQPFLTDEAARAITATVVLECSRAGCLETLIKDSGQRNRILDISKDFIGGNDFDAEMRAGLTTTTTPLPTVYVPQVIELVWKYGQARQYATVFPLGNLTVKLPRLQAGEDDFAYLGVGAAGMAQSIGEKTVTAELVTFTANKFGGLIRIPTEIEEDTFIPLGQFLARYIARQLAKGEDNTLFLGDGTSTYANITGIGKYATTNTAYLTQLASTKTKPSDATLADFRAMRAQVNAAILASNSAAYYMSPTFDAILPSFNTVGAPLIYQRMPDGTGKLDGYPIRWINSSQPYKTTAAASTYLAFFGDLSYWYLGERGAPRVEVSREVFFATDEIAMRALERIDVEAMAIDAMSVLKTAAS